LHAAGIHIKEPLIDSPFYKNVMYCDVKASV